MTPEEEWCLSQWNLMTDGGVWAVPRSGLIFKKLGKENRLLLIEKMPHDEGMPLNAVQLAAVQEGDFLTIREHFSGIGISVERTPVPG